MWWRVGYEDHVGPDPPRSEWNCLLRAQGGREDSRSPCSRGRGVPRPACILVSLAASFPGTWWGIRTAGSLGCAPYIRSGVRISAGEASAPPRCGVEGNSGFFRLFVRPGCVGPWPVSTRYGGFGWSTSVSLVRYTHLMQSSLRSPKSVPCKSQTSDS